MFRCAVTTACILGSDYTSNCFLANELFRPVRARRVFGVLNFIIQKRRDAKLMIVFLLRWSFKFMTARVGRACYHGWISIAGALRAL